VNAVEEARALLAEVAEAEAAAKRACDAFAACTHPSLEWTTAMLDRDGALRRVDRAVAALKEPAPRLLAALCEEVDVCDASYAEQRELSAEIVATSAKLRAENLALREEVAALREEVDGYRSRAADPWLQKAHAIIADGARSVQERDAELYALREYYAAAEAHRAALVAQRAAWDEGVRWGPADHAEIAAEARLDAARAALVKKAGT